MKGGADACESGGGLGFRVAGEKSGGLAGSGAGGRSQEEWLDCLLGGCLENADIAAFGRSLTKVFGLERKPIVEGTSKGRIGNMRCDDVAKDEHHAEIAYCALEMNLSFLEGKILFGPIATWPNFRIHSLKPNIAQQSLFTSNLPCLKPLAFYYFLK